jgi:tellurite resistance protein
LVKDELRQMKMPVVPASFFAMVLGTVGLGNAWRAASHLWALPPMIGEAIMAVGFIIWALLALLYLAKWIASPELALSEVADAIQCCFVGLIGVATMLAATAVLPYATIAAEVIFAIGAVFTFGFGIWRTGHIWRGGRNHAATTPILYLPLVAGSFVCSIGLSLFGLFDWAQLSFGAGFFTWLAIESVLLHRLYTAEPLAEALRPTLGIQLAPPAVGAVAYVLANASKGDMAAHALIGYAILQMIILAGMIRWILSRFSASLWSFSFGATALATITITLTSRGDTGAIAMLAPITFGIANLIVAGLAIGTLFLLFSGRLLPQRPAAPPQPVAKETTRAA